MTSVTNALNQTTSFRYGAAGDLMTIVDADNRTAASFTDDGFDRIRAYTDSEGWTVTYDYDAADRITKIRYPDGTTDRFTRDRLGWAWRYAHNADRRLTQVTDPPGEETQFGYDNLDDSKNNRTQWARDLEGQVIRKTHPDNRTVTFA